MRQWAGHPELEACPEGFCEEYLHDMLRGEALSMDTCSMCHCSNTLLYQCESCFGRAIVCTQCCLNQHASNPLHVVQVGSISMILQACLHRDRYGLGLSFDGPHSRRSVSESNLDTTEPSALILSMQSTLWWSSMLMAFRKSMPTFATALDNYLITGNSYKLNGILQPSRGPEPALLFGSWSSFTRRR